MTKGRSGGYTCKSLRGHTGRVVGLVYLQGNSSQLPNLQSSNAIVCSASSDGTVRAWNVQNGGLLWCSPVQSPLTGILTDEECKVVITSDSTGLVKTWQGQTGQEVASYSTASPHCTLLQYNMNNGWFLTPARLAVIHHSENRRDKALTVFDVSIKKMKYKTEIQVQQVESFPLMLSAWSSGLHLAAKSSNCMVLAAGEQLWLYSLKGVLLSSFKDHTGPITSISVDSFRVVTASQDLSLRVLTWRNHRDGGLTLESRYHLLGGSHTMARGFTHVACDYSSIVASVEGNDGKDVLKAYSFTS
uniref:F-box and WD repeat domain containing 12 n=1 Tax=Nothobranchius rachovii TaxID=451742 RepID=A0A1A8RKS2_9TELE